jgi:hypothetical protein
MWTEDFESGQLNVRYQSNKKRRKKLQQTTRKIEKSGRIST